MKPNKKLLSLALAALILSGQLTLPAAALAEVSPAALQGDLNITETFSDQKLQSWLKNAGNLGGIGADGILTEEERNGVTELDLSGLGLTSLDNLSAFPNLKTLNCANNWLTTLDVSGNPLLESLSCGNNLLTELNVSANKKLRYLNCNFNRIKHLDLTGLSALVALYCEMNQMESLNLSGCTELLIMYCRNNQLTELNLKDNGKLVFIETFDNRLTEIDVTHLTDLQFLHIDHNKLTELDMRGNQKLEGGGFVARNNYVEKIYLPVQPSLTVYLDDYNEQDPIEGADRVKWYLDKEFQQEAPEELTANGQTLYSKRIPNQYTVYFAANGGSGSMDKVSSQWGETFELPANKFNRTGYTFAGWGKYGYQTAQYGDKASVSNLAGKKTDGDRVTLYAHWEANSYTIHLDPNGGQGEVEDISAKYGQTVTLNNSFQPASDEMEFAGWGLSKEGPVRYPDGAAVQNLTAEPNGEFTLYAQWRKSLAGEKKGYLESLEQEFQRLGSSEGEELRYTQEDWEDLSNAYAAGASAIQEAGDTNAMEQALQNAIAEMKAVPTMTMRVKEVTDGWQSAHEQVLSLLSARNLTESDADTAAAEARGALEDLATALADYSNLTNEQDRTQVAGLAAIALQKQGEALMTMEQAALWLQSLGGLTLRDMTHVQAEDLDAYQVAVGHYELLDAEQKAYISSSVETALTERLQLAGQKRSDAADLQSAYDGLDQSLYSEKGKTALKAALQSGLNAIASADSVEDSQQARQDAWTQISRVPTADQETTEPPAPPEGGGSTGGGGGTGGGGSTGGGAGGGGGAAGPEEPEKPAPGETVTVTDEKTGASAQVTTSADGKVTAQVTVPQNVSHATIRIPCKGDAGTVAVLVGEDGSRRVLPYSVYENGSLAVRLDGSAHIELVDGSKTFSDISSDAWYADAVQFTASRELFSGVGGGAFAPRQTMTRAMLVTVLHRLEGTPAVSGSGAFQDVPADAWYSEAAQWASEQGISGGTGSAAFDPSRAITREQLAVMLYRYAGSPALTEKQTVDAFGDGAQVSDWARDAMVWACANGILTGDNNKLLRPQDNSTRAEVSAMLERFVEQAVR